MARTSIIALATFETSQPASKGWLTSAPLGGIIAFRYGEKKNEISRAKGVELRDNGFNPGGLAIWDGIGQMDRKHQFEAEATAAVSGPEYFALQILQNKPYTDRP
jgi:hypothetical protein